jgi:membrane protease subunit (stomatin/prohibitin family)
VEVHGGILQNLHDVMYMSINHGKIIDDFKECGKVDVRESLHKHRPSDAWRNYFWTYYHQFGK